MDSLRGVRFVAWGVCAAGWVLRATAVDTEFAERFALAEDRATVLSELIPGTEDHYFYQALLAQTSGRLDDVPALMTAWRKQHGESARYLEIENRQALLTYAKDPKRALDLLRRRLNLRFDHQQEKAQAPAQFPAELDPKRVDADAFQKLALSRQTGLGGFEDAGLARLSEQALPYDRCREFLERLPLPDLPGVVGLVVSEFKAPQSRGFGSLPIHGKLLLDQLEAVRTALLGSDRDVSGNDAFVNAVLVRLVPPADADPAGDVAVRGAYLARVWAFVSGLPASQNSLKAASLFRLLSHERTQGRYDRELFLTYLRLPRQVSYIRREYLQRPEFQGRMAAMDKAFEAVPLLLPVGNDEPLVRDQLAHWLLEAEDYRAFAEWLDDDYLREVFAETKILAGVGDMERWYGLMSPAKHQALRDRVDLALLPTNPETFAPDAEVALDIAVKNVARLRVRIYELDAFNFYREMGEDLTTAVDLDGIVPNGERTVDYPGVSPLRRHVEKFTFAELKQPGVYVVEWSGNGVSSRALVRKGRLRFVDRPAAAGHVFTAFDDRGQVLKDASIWFSGQVYAADPADGEIAVPFRTAGDDAAEQSFVLRQGRLAAPGRFQHLPERYALTLGTLLDRENLLAGAQATLVLRPSLSVNGQSLPLKLLEHPVLELRLRDVEGIEAVQRVEGLALKDEEDFVHSFRVPPRTVLVSVHLSGKVRNLSRNRDDALVADSLLVINGVLGMVRPGDLDVLNGGPATDRPEDLFLRRVDGGYWLEARGRNGEVLPSRTARLKFKHRLFREQIDLTLQGDEAGRIRLGALPGIVQMVVEEGVVVRSWPLGEEFASRIPLAIHALEGEEIVVPGDGLDPANLRSGLSLLAGVSPAQPVRDRLDAAKLADGQLRIAGLEAGDYRLVYRERGETVDLRVTRGVVAGRVLVGTSRALELTPQRLLRVGEITRDGDSVRIRVANATASTRLHVVARRVLGDESWVAFDPGVPAADAGVAAWPAALTAYVSGRAVGDEARYVEDRRDARRFPGNMLERPSLILQPWSRTATTTRRQDAATGEDWQEAGAIGALRGMAGGQDRKTLAYGLPTGSGAWRPTSTLDFLPAPSRVWTNLRPVDGVVTIPVAELAGRQEILVVAADGTGLSGRRVSLAETPWQPRDLRLAQALDPARPFAQRQAVTGVAAGAPFVVDDLASARVEIYDSLAQVFRLYQSLRPDPTLEKFAFVLEWPDLPEERRQALYSEFACHELNVFLYFKDRPFFDRVVLPYLKNKRDPRFLDHWLLGQDLAAYAEPGAYLRLNTFERIVLARRLPGRREDVARQTADLLALVPPDPEAFERRFQTAMRSGALESAGIGGEIAEKNALAAAPPAPSAAPAAPAARTPAKPRAAMADAEQQLGLMNAAPAEQAKAQREVAGADKREEALDGLRRADRNRAAERRKSVSQLYRAPEQTREWVDTHYYGLAIEAETADRVPVNAFWNDYAAAADGAPFLSGHVAEADGTFTERMLALAVLDLPFKAAAHRETPQDGRWTFVPGSHAVLFHQQVVTAAPERAGTRPVMVVENVFEANDRYRMEGAERVDRFVREEFVAGRVYGAQVVLTNPTSRRRRLSLLVQVPEGALPLKSGLATRSVPFRLEPYTTATYEYMFYFPEARDEAFRHFPASVSEDGNTVGRADALALRVVARPSVVDKTSWGYVSQRGEPAEVLAFLATENAHAPSVDLERMAWRLRDRAFYDATLTALEKRGIYHRTVWSYAIQHQDDARMRQFLAASETGFRRQCGGWLRSPLLDFDAEAEAEGVYEHREYWPLVNARAHSLGRRRVIANEALAAQYRRCLDLLAYRPALTSRDRLELVGYLLLQDRVADALTQFARVVPDEAGMRMQYAYAQAYLAFSQGQPDEARKIAAVYVEFPVARWRDRFRNIVAQADERTGKAATVQNKDRAEEVQNQLASQAPSLAWTLTGADLEIVGRNVATGEVKVYPMDIEQLFSRSPFIGEGEAVPGRFTFVRPAWAQTVALGAGEVRKTVSLPKEFRTRNLIVEVSGAGEAQRKSYTPNTMNVQVVASYGQVRVRQADNVKPVAGAYVKVYARDARGGVRFHKDGYTDLRGVFDYASISTSDLDEAQNFAILVLDDRLGAVIRQAAPPAR